MNGRHVLGRVTMELYIKQLSTRYRQASKKEKGLMLDEFCKTSGYSRKHAIKLIQASKKRLNMPSKQPPRRKPGPKPSYQSTELIEALKKIWLATDQMCGKRLKPALRDWLPHYEKHHPSLSKETKAQLKKISSASIDRVLSPFRAKLGKGKNGTKPGTLIKTQIPILTEQWDNSIPGFVEADTVAHCGDSLAGDFVWSLTLTDICTGWTELRALWGKGATGVVNAISDIESTLPFILKGFDSDNGSEFLNYHLLRYFAHPDEKEKLRLKFTRSRPYKKDDNAHVEQKNWTHVRQLVGYHRFDNKNIVELLNQLYANEISKLNNYFCPCVKLLAKERVNSKIKKKHSEPMTPYQRILVSEHISDAKKEMLTQQYQQLDPFELKTSIEKQLSTIFKLVSVKDTVSRTAI